MADGASFDTIARIEGYSSGKSRSQSNARLRKKSSKDLSLLMLTFNEFV
jgi:hypothetical protein